MGINVQHRGRSVLKLLIPLNVASHEIHSCSSSIILLEEPPTLSTRPIHLQYLRSIVALSSLILLAVFPYAAILPAITPRVPIEGGANGGAVDTSFGNIQCHSGITGTSSSQQDRWMAVQGDLASSTLGREFTFNPAVREQA